MPEGPNELVIGVFGNGSHEAQKWLAQDDSLGHGSVLFADEIDEGTGLSLKQKAAALLRSRKGAVLSILLVSLALASVSMLGASPKDTYRKETAPQLSGRPSIFDQHVSSPPSENRVHKATTGLLGGTTRALLSPPNDKQLEASEPAAAQLVAAPKRRSRPGKTQKKVSRAPEKTMQEVLAHALEQAQEGSATKAQAEKILRSIVPGMTARVRAISACDSISGAPIRVLVEGPARFQKRSLQIPKDTVLFGQCSFKYVGKKGIAEIAFDRVIINGQEHQISARAATPSGAGYVSAVVTQDKGKAFYQAQEALVDTLETVASEAVGGRTSGRLAHGVRTKSEELQDFMQIPTNNSFLVVFEEKVF